MEDYNDTLGAGSYPSPEEPKSKMYKVKCTYDVYINVQAENKEEAMELANLDSLFGYEIDKNSKEVYDCEVKD